MLMKELTYLDMQPDRLYQNIQSLVEVYEQMQTHWWDSKGEIGFVGDISFSLKTPLILFRFHIPPPGRVGWGIYICGSGHMYSMPALCIKPKKIFCSRTIEPVALQLDS